MAHYLITGASSGLGEALAVELGRRHHTVGLIARRGDRLEQVAQKVRLAGGTAAWQAADVTDRPGLTAAIRALEETLGPVDCCVANAGSGGSTPATDPDAERISAMMRLNFDGMVHTLAAVLPEMVARKGGHVAAVSSVAGWRGLAGSGTYSASKAAVSTLLEAWSIELRPHGVAVTTIHPGFVETPLTAKNRFPMPFLLDASTAARLMADGLERRRRYVNYPWRMAWLMAFVRALPWWLYEPLLARVGPKRVP